MHNYYVKVNQKLCLRFKKFLTFSPEKIRSFFSSSHLISFFFRFFFLKIQILFFLLKFNFVFFILVLFLFAYIAPSDMLLTTKINFYLFFISDVTFIL